MFPNTDSHFPALCLDIWGRYFRTGFNFLSLREMVLKTSLRTTVFEDLTRAITDRQKQNQMHLNNKKSAVYAAQRALMNSDTHRKNRQQENAAVVVRQA